VRNQSSRLTSWGRIVAGPKTKFITIALWVIIAAVLGVVAPSVNSQENNNAANLPASAQSVQAQAQIAKTFTTQSGLPALTVWYRASGLTPTDLRNIQKVAAYLRLHPLPQQKSIVPIDEMPSGALAQLESKDRTTLVLPVVFHSNADSTTLQGAMTTMQHDVVTATGQNPFADNHITSPGLHARITGPVGIATDALGLFKNADFALLGATTLLVLVLLIALYRSPVLAFVPLFSVGVAYAVISPVLGLLAKSGAITVDAQGVSIMTVLLFGAGTDYCLFLVARYRERLVEVDNKHVAIREAVGGAAGAIAMSGLTVVLSLLTLLLAKYGSNFRFAIPFSVAVLIIAFVAVTFVPAVLAVFGRASFWPFVPRTERMSIDRAAKRGKPARLTPSGPGRLSRWVGAVVSTKPWTVIAVSTVILVILAAFSTQIKTTYDLLQSFPKDMPSRQGFTILSQHESPGSLAPVQVLIEAQSGLQNVESNLKQLAFVSSVSESSVKGHRHLLQLTLSENPESFTAMNDIPVIRRAAVQGLQTAGVTNPQANVWIAGETATQHDTQVTTTRDTQVIIPVVIGIIAILLLIYLKSVVATIYLILSVLLSYFAALGTGWLIVHNLLGASAIQGAIPLYSFVFLVALGEDYNIFMVSRIWQERNFRPLRAAISEGVSRTSSVITSAGLILAGTFAVLASLPIQVLVQFGLITAIGILLDTFVVRPFLVPAITAVLGKSAFWPARFQPIAEDSQ